MQSIPFGIHCLDGETLLCSVSCFDCHSSTPVVNLYCSFTYFSLIANEMVDGPDFAPLVFWP